MSHQITDSDIDLIKAGDRETWQRVREQFGTKAISRANQLLSKSPNLKRLTPEDIAQETWMKAWNHRETFRGSTLAELVRWLQAILRNTFLDECRKKTQFNLTEPGSIKGLERTPSENVRMAEKTTQLESHLQQLDQTSRRIVFLRNNRGLKFREIANQLGMNVNTVSTTYRRAIIQLRLAMSKFESGSQSKGIA